jgi:insulysin
MQDFASYVTSKLARDLDDVLPASEDEFERYRDNLLRALSAFNVKQPYAHAIYYAGLTQQPRNFQYSNDELVQAMKTTTLTQLKDYVKNLWAKGKGECLIQGNYNKQEALEIVETIDKTLAFNTISADKYPKRLRALPLPVTTSAQKPPRLIISEPNPSNNNAASQVTLQCLETSEKSHVLVEIISAIIEEPLFNELRTNQQLGYIVSSGVKAIDQSRTLSLIVQSNIATAEDLTSSILKFLDDVSEKLITPLSSVDIELYVKGLTDSRLEPDKRLAIEVTRNWSEIASGRYQYDRLQAEVGALLSITKQDIVDFWQNLYVKERRILISEVVPKTGPVSTKEPSLGGEYNGGIPVAALGIKDLQKFREYGENEISKMKS